MYRISTAGGSVFLQTLEDVNSYQEPTKSIVLAAIDRLEFRIIEDSIPLETIDWQGFLNSCDLPEKGGNGVFNELLKINFSLAMDAYFLTLRFKSGLAGEEELRTLSFIYSQFIPALSPTVTDSLRAAIEANNIPLAIVQIQN
jgi:hypothetical protein